MKTSIFVIALIIVVFMAGALMLSIVYEKRSEKQKTSRIDPEPFAAMPIVFTSSYAEYTAEAKTPLFKPIVMDLGLSNKHPF